MLSEKSFLIKMSACIEANHCHNDKNLKKKTFRIISLKYYTVKTREHECICFSIRLYKILIWVKLRHFKKRFRVLLVVFVIVAINCVLFEKLFALQGYCRCNVNGHI